METPVHDPICNNFVQNYFCKKKFERLNMLLAAFTAMLPVCELVMARGAEGDEDLNEAGSKLFDGLKLISYATNNLVRRRREALRHKLLKDVADDVINAPLEGKWLFGEKTKDNLIERKEEKRFFNDCMGPDKKEVPPPAKAQNKSNRGNSSQRGRGGYNNSRSSGFQKNQPQPPGTAVPYQSYTPYYAKKDNQNYSQNRGGGHRGGHRGGKKN